MDRIAYWIDFIQSRPITSVVEVGVWRGHFAEAVLSGCPNISKYYLIDPWARLDDWNKPLNSDDLEDALAETRRRLEPFADRCVYLRGRTSEMAQSLPPVDFAYIDGDHTLRGITIDLLEIWPRIRDGGWLGGDDFTPSIWQHESRFEPSMVFPFAVHFAEAMKSPIEAIGSGQFLITKSHEGFRFDDKPGLYSTTELRGQVARPSRLRRLLAG